MKQKINNHYIFIFFFITITLQATESEEPKSDTLSMEGYINYKAYYDTRQDVGVEDDQALFFPKRKVITPTGDVNAKGHGQMVPFETRIRATIKGPNIRENVHEKGIIEVEFKGAHGAPNLINMRHAYGQLDWNNSTFIFGQTWHPLDVIELIANTVSFNEGRPMAVYNRSPQLQYTYHAPIVDIILAAASQVDFKSDGPIGASSTYIRNAIIPNFHFQLKCFFGEHVAGTGIDYQRIAPRIISDTGYKVHEDISSLIGIWYLGLNWPKVEIRNTITFGGNMSNYGIIGGYGIKQGSTNPVTNKQQYATTRTLAVWSDVTIFPAEPIETGFFIGLAKNFGSAHKIEPNVVNAEGVITTRNIFGLGNDLDTVFRFSPRVRFKIKEVTFAGEVEYTRAAFGTLTAHAKAINTVPVANIQLLFSTFFFF